MRAKSTKVSKVSYSSARAIKSKKRRKKTSNPMPSEGKVKLVKKP